MERSLLNYVHELEKIQLIDSEKQVELAIEAKNGNKQSFDKLVESNLRFVYSIANEYKDRDKSISMGDLINSGNIGLMKAVTKFDETVGTKFISYAVYWIRQSINQFIYENSGSVRLPVNRIAIKDKIIKTISELQKELGRDPTNYEIYKKTKIDRESISEFFTDCNFKVSFDSYLHEDSISTVGESIPDSSEEEIESAIDLLDMKSSVENALDLLSKREKKIIKMYFGIGDGEEKTLKEISQELGISNERIRKVKEIALKKLRTYDRGIGLKKYLTQKD